MTLVKQPSSFPTRKVMAVVISGMIMGAAQSLLKLFWPDHPFSPYLADIDIWLQGIVMVAAGYFTRSEENVIVVAETNINEKPDMGTSSQLVSLVVPTVGQEIRETNSGEQTPEGKRG